MPSDCYKYSAPTELRVALYSEAVNIIGCGLAALRLRGERLSNEFSAQTPKTLSRNKKELLAREGGRQSTRWRMRDSVK